MTNTFDNLITQLQSPEVRQRSQAVMALQPGTFSEAAAISALVNVITTDDDLNVVEDATWVLVRYGASATPALLNEITHDLPRARHNVVHALGKIADRAAVPGLVTAVHDSDPTVRLKSVYALGQIGDARGIEALVAALNDPMQDVSWTAREALEGFGREALPQLIQALASESVQVRELAASLLGEIGDKSAVDPLIAALESDDSQVRVAVIEALGNIGDGRALPVVEQFTDDAHLHVRAMAKNAANTPISPVLLPLRRCGTWRI
jgi:HEAT repeat protein